MTLLQSHSYKLQSLSEVAEQLQATYFCKNSENEIAIQVWLLPDGCLQVRVPWNEYLAVRPAVRRWMYYLSFREEPVAGYWFYNESPGADVRVMVQALTSLLDTVTTCPYLDEGVMDLDVEAFLPEQYVEYNCSSSGSSVTGTSAATGFRECFSERNNLARTKHLSPTTSTVSGQTLVSAGRQTSVCSGPSLVGDGRQPSVRSGPTLVSAGRQTSVGSCATLGSPGTPPSAGNKALLNVVCTSVNGVIVRVDKDSNLQLAGSNLRYIRPMLINLFKLSEIPSEEGLPGVDTVGCSVVYRNFEPLAQIEIEYIIATLHHRQQALLWGEDDIKTLPGFLPFPESFRPVDEDGTPMLGPMTYSSGKRHNEGRQYFASYDLVSNRIKGFLWADGTDPFGPEAWARFEKYLIRGTDTSEAGQRFNQQGML